jgi:hypothetical protein
LEGNLLLIDSGSIAVGRDTILLAEMVRVVGKTSGTKKAGPMLIVLGTLTMTMGAVSLADAYSSGGDGWSFSFAEVTEPLGYSLLAVGGLMTTFGVKDCVSGNHYREKHWMFSVQKGSNAKP